MRIVSANLNGVRAARKRGGLDWLADLEADVVCFQEVRASQAQLSEALKGTGFADWTVSYAPCVVPGRCGVAVLSQETPAAVRVAPGFGEFADCGRWIEVDFDPTDSRLGAGVGRLDQRGVETRGTAGGADLLLANGFTVISVYVPKGEVGTEKQERKYSFLDQMTRRLEELSHAGREVVVAGDLNIAHETIDLKNWRGNVGKAGFVDIERAYITRWLTGLSAGWVDLGRKFVGPLQPGPYTWWSWRGKAFDTDAGWRIDYLLATPGIASGLKDYWVGRADTYQNRWSDHASVIADIEPAG